MIETQVQVRFNDLDVFGHINNNVQQSYFDIGRADYIGNIYGADFFSCKTVLLVVSIKTDFLKQITIHDEVTVRTQCYRLGGKSIKMFQQLVDRKGNVFTQSYSVMACVDREQNQSVEVPREFREIIARLEQKDIEFLEQNDERF